MWGGYPPDIHFCIPGLQDFQIERNFATVWSRLLKFRVRSSRAKAVCLRSVFSVTKLFHGTVRAGIIAPPGGDDYLASYGTETQHSSE